MSEENTNVIQYMHKLKNNLLDLKLPKGDVYFVEYYTLLHKYSSIKPNHNLPLLLKPPQKQQIDRWIAQTEKFMQKVVQ